MDVFDIMQQERSNQYAEANQFLNDVIKNNELTELEIATFCEYLPTQPRFNLTEKSELIVLTKEIKGDIEKVENLNKKIHKKMWDEYLKKSKP